MPSPEFLSLQRAVMGRYSLDRELGRGGMGVVFLARDVALDRLVAVKLLPAETAVDPDVRGRFVGEARTAAALSHPHIVPIHAVEETDAAVFFVMSYVDGETLGARVRRTGPLSAAETMRIVQEVAWALAHAHARGVVHRDVKPDNGCSSAAAAARSFSISGSRTPQAGQTHRRRERRGGRRNT